MEDFTVRADREGCSLDGLHWGKTSRYSLTLVVKTLGEIKQGYEGLVRFYSTDTIFDDCFFNASIPHYSFKRLTGLRQEEIQVDCRSSTLREIMQLV